MKTPEQILDRQREQWIEEMSRLASLISSLEGQNVAVVLVTADVDEYGESTESVHPVLVLEDALRVSEFGWPTGFSFEILNKVDTR